jgi:hypothetical protein
MALPLPPAAVLIATEEVFVASKVAVVKQMTREFSVVAASILKQAQSPVKNARS